VIAVAVRDEDVLHVGRIEMHRLQAIDDLRLGRVVVERVDHDDARARRERPRRVETRAEKVEVVEDLLRLGVIRVAAGIGAVVPDRRPHVGHHAVASQHADPIESRGVLCRFEVRGIGVSRRSLAAVDGESRHKAAEHDPE
jgi:hypothetical protein